MKTAFFHDCVFIKEEDGQVYTTGGLNDKKLEEYVHYFGDLTVFSRERKMNSKDQKNKMSIASTSGVIFDSIPKLDFFSLLFGKIRTRIKKLVNDSKLVIIRMPSYIGIIAANEAKKQGKNYLIEMVACPWDALWNYGKIQKKLFALPTYLMNKKVVKEAPSVIYVSEQFLQNRYPTNGNHVGCSDVVLPPVEESILPYRLAKIAKMDSTIKIGTLANLALKCKGQHFVIRAIANLKNKGIQVEYYLAGGGNPSYLTEMTKKYHVEENVHIMGSLPHDKVFELLDDIDIYVQPSLQEGLPRAVVEAMSKACPVIGSRTGGIPELIGEAYIFERKEIKGIENKIIELVNNRELLVQAARQNFEKAKEFELEKLSRKRETFYQKIIGE
jgi:glycosyltransferase involved in cell wall biosynthesis